MPEVFYTTRETVMRALDIKVSAYASDDVDRAILSSGTAVEGLTHRIFYPMTATKSWPYPNYQGETNTLWLDQNELVSLTTFTAGGTTIPSTDYYLEPNEYGPPYNRIEVRLDTSSALAAGNTPQRSLSLAGVFSGAPVVEVAHSTLENAIADASTTTVTLKKPADVGSLLRVESERMIVTEKAFVTSGQTVQTPLTASMSNRTVAVTNGAVFTVRETLLIDSERMLIVDIAGNNLTVTRAVDGSTLATHTGSTIFWAHECTVERGALGTTAASHADDTAVVRHKYPALIQQLTIAYSLIELLGESTGMARQSGQPGGNSRTGIPTLDDLSKLEQRVITAHGRKLRARAV